MPVPVSRRQSQRVAITAKPLRCHNSGVHGLDRKRRSTPRKRRGGGLDEYRVPTEGGRELLIRPCVLSDRPQLQVAILSTRGNIIDAVTIETGDVLGLARALGKVGRRATEQTATAKRMDDAENRRRYREALEANPWQRELRQDREGRGLR